MALHTPHHRRRPVVATKLLLPCGLTAIVLTPPTHAAPAPPVPASVRLPRFVPEHQPLGIRPGEASSFLWQNARLAAPTTTPAATTQQIQQNIRAILVADPSLSQAYAWRQVLRGSTTQKWSLTESSAGNMQLQIGRHTLPVMQLTGITGARAAAGLSGDSFGFYSTKPLSLLNSSLKAADELLGDTVSNDATELNWISLRPLKTARGTVDVVYLQGQNDLSPTSLTKQDSQFRRGKMAGAKIAYALPARWKLNGEWMNGRMENQKPDDAIILALAGPVKHPWGETGVRFSYRDVGTDFSSFAGTPADAGQTTRQLSLNQPFKKGAFSGAIGLNWSEIASNGDDTTIPAAPSDTNLQATSSLRWQATPVVALTASHAAGTRLVEQAPVTSLLDQLDQQVTERENRDSRFGLEWRLSKQFSLAASGGTTQYDEETAGNRFLRRLSNRDNYYSLALKNQSSDIQWNLQFERRMALDLEGETGTTADTVSFGAQKRLTSWLKFGGTYRMTQTEYLSSGLDVPLSNLTANTTLSLQELGSLELRYTQAMNCTSDGVRLNSENRASGFGLRYVLGPQSGKGLGLSLDYSRQEFDGPADEQWKIGLTYR